MKKLTFGMLMLCIYVFTSFASLQGEITSITMWFTFFGIQAIMILFIYFYPDIEV